MRRKACERCISKKLKCSEQRPCDKCVRANVQCISKRIAGLSNRRLLPTTQNRHLTPKADPAVLEETNISDLSKSLLEPLSTSNDAHDAFAIPGHSSRRLITLGFSWNEAFRHSLPPAPLLDILINQYFLSVNWFMLVVDEDNFRTKISGIVAADQILGSDRNFCLLTQLICALGAHYLLTDPETSLDKTSLHNIKLEYLDELERQFFAVISEPDLEAVQILILLGSFCLFNERPNVGYGLLGSGIKIAQLLGLHRAMTRIPTSVSSRDSQFKVWWALEIFEKYAAVAFGRPCGIDDSDCDVAEIEDMEPGQPLLCRSEGAVTILTYQKMKCRLYRITGPFLGRRKESSNAKSIAEVHQDLLRWHASIPTALRSEVDRVTFENRPEFIQLQALALQLAYDNLQIVLHRQAVFATTTSETTSADKQRSVDQLLASANRTADATNFKVAEAISRSSHAAMHFGICLFTAGVVLCALSSTTTSGSRKTERLESVDRIAMFLKNFPGQQYSLAAQSHEILETLRSRCSDQSGAHADRETDLEVADTILESSASFDEHIAGFDFPEQTDPVLQLDHAPDVLLQDALQSWLWTDH